MVKLFNECRGIANKIPGKIVFDETLDCLQSPDTLSLTSSKQSFDKLKVDYIDVARNFISDLKKSLQESGDQVVDFHHLETQILDSFERKMNNVDQDFVSIFFWDPRMNSWLIFVRIPATKVPSDVQAKGQRSW
jgi:hypothetical protein